MRIFDNGTYRDATPAEIATLEAQQAGQIALPLTIDQRCGMLETQIITINSNAIKNREINLLASNWSGSGELWSQVVTINGVTVNSRVDLDPTPLQLGQLCNYELSLMASNTDGVITIFALGGQPTFDITNLQISILEISNQ